MEADLVSILKEPPSRKRTVFLVIRVVVSTLVLAFVVYNCAGALFWML
jgi:hypothetical protein